MICRYQRLILFRTEGFEQERTEGTEQKYYNIKNLFTAPKGRTTTFLDVFTFLSTVFSIQCGVATI